MSMRSGSIAGNTIRPRLLIQSPSVPGAKTDYSVGWNLCKLTKRLLRNRRTFQMSAKTELDATDRRILRILSLDGRASYQAVADEIGLSRPAIMERVKRLEEAGYIRGFGVQLDRTKVGVPVTAFVAVRYGSSDYVGDEPRMREMEKHPGVLECHHVAGDDCYILKVVAPDLEGVQEILRDLRGPNAQMNTRTTIVLSTVFEKPGFIATVPD